MALQWVSYTRALTLLYRGLSYKKLRFKHSKVFYISSSFLRVNIAESHFGTLQCRKLCYIWNAISYRRDLCKAKSTPEWTTSFAKEIPWKLAKTTPRNYARVCSTLLVVFWRSRNFWGRRLVNENGGRRLFYDEFSVYALFSSDFTRNQLAYDLRFAPGFHNFWHYF